MGVNSHNSLHSIGLLWLLLRLARLLLLSRWQQMPIVSRASRLLSDVFRHGWLKEAA